MTNEAKRSEESGSSAELERMATELAELANSCCFRSDGWEESLRERILEKLKEAIVMEREECAKICDWLASDDNPYGHDQCDGADEAGKLIRMRSSVEGANSTEGVGDE